MKRVIAIISILIILIIAYGVYYFFYDISNLPIGEFRGEFISPDGKFSIKQYISSPALSSSSIRCEIVDNVNNTKRNIYWGYRESNAKITWIDNTTVCINGHLLNVFYDAYDWRKK